MFHIFYIQLVLTHTFSNKYLKSFFYIFIILANKLYINILKH